MTVKIEKKYLLLAAVLAWLNPDCPVAEGCENALKNIAVYEGVPASFPRLNNGAIAKWRVLPSSTTSFQIDSITNDDGTVSPAFADTYAVNGTQITIFKATVAPQGSMKYSTSGRYQLTYNNTNCEDMAVLVVIRSGPVITFDTPDPNSVKLSCSAVYARYEYEETDPIMTWKSNSGATVKVEQPSPTNIEINNPGLRSSVSQLSIASNDENTYECQLTFSAPRVHGYAAWNAPDFIASSSITIKSTKR